MKGLSILLLGIKLITMFSNKSLKAQTLSGIAWRGSSDVIQQVLQIIFTMILARLLSKSDFGLVTMAMLVNRFVVSMTNIGFGGAIIQSQTINKNQISAIFYIQLALNVFLTIVVFFGANIAALFFKEPELVPLIKGFSFIILLQSLQFPNILLRKELKFKSFSLIEIYSLLLSNGIATVLAVQGFGVWALVWRLIIQRLIFGLLSFYYGKWIPIKPEFKGIKPLFKFGFNMLGSNIVYYFAENLVAIMTGKYLGKDVLGLFNIAYNLAIIPASKIKNVIASVLTPGFSKIQDNVKKNKENYSEALRITSLFFIPFMVMLMAISTNLILVFYGLKWQDARNMLLVLSLVGILRGISSILRSAIIAKGKSSIIFISTIFELLPSLPIMYLLMPYYGVYGLIFGYLAGALIGWVYTTFHYNKIIKFKNGVLKTIKSALGISVILFFLIYCFNYLQLKPIVVLIGQMIFGLVFFVVLLRYFENKLYKNFILRIKSVMYQSLKRLKFLNV
ncbi:lipopolysaccharide biosynthesis protein [Thalassobellus citreus]|uniref:lipopolysaccharide biosynthesis protein n=1 Tax=Thalassobellus citreus TaxID=3367752 RepID=UPI0037A14E0E